MKRNIALDVEYPHPPAKVWRALTDPEALSAWLMPTDFRPELGHRFTFRTEPAPGFDGVVHCEVIELVPEQRLAFTWKGGPIDTIARWRLEPTATGTRLCFEQTGFEGLKAVAVSFLLGRGSKVMYRRLLPAWLDHVDDGLDAARDAVRRAAGRPAVAARAA